MSIKQRDMVTVCRRCFSSDLDGLQHGQAFDCGTPDAPDLEIVCLWPCGHAYIPNSREPRCYMCEPLRPEEVPF